MTFIDRLDELEARARIMGKAQLVHNPDPWHRAQALAEVLRLALPEALDPDIPLMAIRQKRRGSAV